MSNESVCPICEEGNLEAKVGTNKVEYKSETKNLPMYFSVCGCCGSEQASPAEARQNKEQMIKFKKQVETCNESGLFTENHDYITYDQKTYEINKEELKENQ